MTSGLRSLTPARAWAYAGLVLGGGVSLAANIASSMLRPDPPLGAILSSVLWPILLFVATETILRNAFRGLRAILAWVGLAPVAIIAAVASYQHLSTLLAAYGETSFVSFGGPLAIDGLMILSTGLLFLDKPHAQPETVESTEQAPPAPAETVATVHPLDAARSLGGLSLVRRQQVDRIIRAVPNPADRARLTWTEIGELVGVSGRESLKRIRAALTHVDGQIDPGLRAAHGAS